MNRIILLSRIALAAVSIAAPGFGQEQWETGIAGGYGFYKNVTAVNARGEASVGFKSGVAISGVAGNDINNWLGGEIRYTYRRNDLKVSAGSTNVQFSGDSHIINYDFLFHFAPKASRVRPFLAGGAGVKYYRGTGKETATQPLIQFVALTKTGQVAPVVSFGGGVKIHLSPRLLLRLEAHDYTGPFPRQVVAPVPGAKVSGWLHDIVPSVGLSFLLRR